MLLHQNKANHLYHIKSPQRRLQILNDFLTYKHQRMKRHNILHQQLKDQLHTQSFFSHAISQILPTCPKCTTTMQYNLHSFFYNNQDVICDGCEKTLQLSENTMLFHCPNNQHEFDYCQLCGLQHSSTQQKILTRSKKRRR